MPPFAPICRPENTLRLPPPSRILRLRVACEGARTRFLNGQTRQPPRNIQLRLMYKKRSSPHRSLRPSYVSEVTTQ